MLKWPDRAAVEQAARSWGADQRLSHPELRRAGYFGSYARGNWGVGSDLDLLVIVEHAARAFADRPLDWDTADLPVPTDLLVYTEQEWARLQAEGHPFIEVLQREVVWL